MLETSFLLFLGHFFAYLFLPCFCGIPFLFFVFGKKFQSVELYVLSWFLGIGYLTFFLYLLQFVYFGVGIWEYFLALFSIIFLFLWRTIFLQKENPLNYLSCLEVRIHFKELTQSFGSMGKLKQFATLFMGGYVFLFTAVALSYNVSFPTYFDDTFGNWNLSALHIYFDGGFYIFGETDEILGYGGRVNYPIFINILKASISNFMGAWYEMYQNLYQFLSYFMLSMFVFIISYKRTKDIFYAILPVFLLSGLSLLFYHTIDGYMDIVCGYYAVFVIYFLYCFIQNWKQEDFLAALIFSCLLMNIKNDAFVVYLPGILIAFALYLFLSKKIGKCLSSIFDPKMYLSYALSLGFFFIPPVFVRLYHGFALNPQAGDGHQSESFFHPEIFKYFDDIFLYADNYNLILVFILLIFLYQKKNDTRFILLAFLCIFFIFCLVFLFTSNYRWVLDQTTVNRVFLTTFFILISFTSFFLKEAKQ